MSTNIAEESNINNTMTEMIACEDCGQMVPELNMTIHRAHGCRGVARSSPSAAATSSSTRQDDNHNEEQLEAEAGTSTTAATSSCEEEDDDDEIIDLSADSPASSKGSRRKRQDESAPSSPPPRRRQRRGRPKRDQDEEESDDAMEIDDSDDHDDEVEIVTNNNSNEVEIVDNPENPANVASSSSVAAAASATAEVVELLDDEDDDDDEWACERCTLLNDKAKPQCEACGARNPSFGATSSSRGSDGVRAPDATRRERLIDDDDFFPAGAFGGGGAGGGSPLSLVGGGALLGGFLGAAGNYMHGRSVTSGAFQGGVAGAAGGLLVNELQRNSNNNSSNRQRQRQHQHRHSAPATNGSHSGSRRRYHYDIGSNQLSEARSAGANGQPAYPVMDRRSSGRAAPRSSIRVVNQAGPNGTTHTIVSSSGREGNTRIIRRSTHSHGGHGGHDDLLGLMLHTMMQERAGGRMSARFGGGMGGGDAIDRMSYEQLLAAFGDGSENRGASIQNISALPTAKVKAKADGSIDLPAEALECSICLEEFEEGQIRKTLPCLHGFHSACVDKWLQTNGACPVCKFRVDERGSSSS